LIAFVAKHTIEFGILALALLVLYCYLDYKEVKGK